ncbi:unnamed protein product (macronuclear) [Paramecium tetraurelia]|uniref:Uncharacterized protein n=1 Tax=Paramecium tetraurelia TaxID=5888 RepID=A0BEJ9_PARTE|nr:uncharacterized protein GSPATT00027999001 [Paramecium tetraurelia]CAK56966.1 unnamed protein product [Paramecium tetraurelia]|eukprot:XP_001424364.1 hypothetical protein (macronuclear) [Paramecium tetraurelia strain d4-2]
MRQVDPNVPLQKCEVWEAESQKERECKQIEIPKFTTVEGLPQLTLKIPPTYIHTNITYPDENEYSCDEEDQAAGVDPLTIQQLDIRNNLSNTRNYVCQYELLNSINYPPEYYNAKVDRLQRPLLRVFMRAQENDYRMNMAFRPRRSYKQKRLKRLNIQLPEFDVGRQIIYNENLIALQLISQIKQRELLKLKLIKQDEQEFTNTFNNCQEIFNTLKDLRLALKEEEPQENKDHRSKIFDSCQDPECAYQFTPPLISQTLIEFMDDQYSTIKDKQVLWPKQPTVLSDWNLDNYSKIGVYQSNQQLVYSTFNRTLLIQDRTKKNKKKVKLMLVDRNRASVFDGVRADYEHFYSHYQRQLNNIEASMEQQRKEIQKMRQEQAKKEVMLKMLQKKEEQRRLLKIRLKVNYVEEPKIVKTVKIKHSDDLKFLLVKHDSSSFEQKQENCQIILQ